MIASAARDLGDDLRRRGVILFLRGFVGCSSHGCSRGLLGFRRGEGWDQRSGMRFRVTRVFVGIGERDFEERCVGWILLF